MCILWVQLLFVFPRVSVIEAFHCIDWLKSEKEVSRLEGCPHFRDCFVYIVSSLKRYFLRSLIEIEVPLYIHTFLVIVITFKNSHNTASNISTVRFQRLFSVYSFHSVALVSSEGYMLLPFPCVFILSSVTLPGILSLSLLPSCDRPSTCSEGCGFDMGN